MILMIDNYDSFTWNLVQYLFELGAEVEVVRNDAIELDEVERRAPTAVVVSPGPCTPREAGISVPLIQRFGGKLPILGVCLGHQSIGAALGGDLPRVGHPRVLRLEHGEEHLADQRHQRRVDDDVAVLVLLRVERHVRLAVLLLLPVAVALALAVALAARRHCSAAALGSSWL